MVVIATGPEAHCIVTASDAFYSTAGGSCVGFTAALAVATAPIPHYS